MERIFTRIRNGFSGIGLILLLGTAVAEAQTPIVVERDRLTPAHVTITPGETVVFHSTEDVAGGHRVVAEDGSFESPFLTKDDFWTRRFDTVGTFRYSISERSEMQGTIVVQPAPLAETTPEPVPQERPVESEIVSSDPTPVSDRNPPAAGRVARASFTTNIVSREPVDSITSLSNENRRLHYFTELVGLQGRAVTHRWERAGAVLSQVTFEVGGPRWRVYSIKDLDPSWLGEWTVTVVDESGHVLRRDTFSYLEAGAPPPVPAAPQD